MVAVNWLYHGLKPNARYSALQVACLRVARTQNVTSVCHVINNRAMSNFAIKRLLA